MDEVTISRAITESYMKDLIDSMVLDTVVVGAGPAGLLAAYNLAREGVKVAVFERRLSVGGGMWGGGMMFSRIVVQDAGREILDEIGVRCSEYEPGYYIADAIEAVTTITSEVIRAGARIFNLMSVEDVVVRDDDRIHGVVINWSAVELSKLHVDPMTVIADYVIDATGHAAEVARIVEQKLGGGALTVRGERPMWAEAGEAAVVENTKEIYPGLIVAGMAANAVLGSPRMGPVFGGMLLSGRKAAELVLSRL
ncbi:MAG TPA: thiazole biosynthesis protein [Candidatus Syntrophoarchaeum butanivorans]|uniref:Thiamine thiazole synthase n=1 Tax=Candidatus Syntropharchaeum butanivorans TaxID=1839936 RepID=A0A7C1B4P8_9EURY|nr:thiazole biosynthesis protein [Candidatus Syntrophoarchaeum butanivorans]